MIKPIQAAFFKKPTSEDVERVLKIFELIWNKISLTIRDPLANPRETVVIIGALVVIFLILITLILLTTAYKYELERRPAKKRKPKKTLSPQQLKTRYLAIGIILAVISLAALGYSSRADFCSQCHLLDKEYRSWQRSEHSWVNCLSCHTEPGLFGFALSKLNGWQNLVNYAFNNYDLPLSAVVRNSSCLQCHEPRIAKTFETSGIRISHKKINEAGFRCVECHADVAHEGGQKSPAMDRCITCHNEQKASSRCSLCHPIDIAYKPGLSLDDFAKVQLDEPTTCRGCHSAEQEKQCLNCHGGIELPHTAGFVRAGHARSAFANKLVCYRCHEPSSCSRCHQGGSSKAGVQWAHGPTWIREHRSKKAEDCLGAPCHGPHICKLCHPEKK